MIVKNKQQKKSKKDLYILIFRYLITIVLFVFFFNKAKEIDFSRLWQIPTETLVYLFAIRFSIYLLVAYRLLLFLRNNSTEVPLFKVFLVNKIGLLISYILPSAIFSDLSKIYFLKDYQTDKTKLLVTIFVDRFVGLLCILFLLMVASATMGVINPEQFYSLFYEKYLVKWTFIIGLVTGVIILPILYWKVSILRQWIKSNLGFLKPSLISKTVMMTIIGHLIYCFLVFEINKEVNSVPLSYTQACIVFPMATLGTTLPTTPGSVGVGQALYKYIFDILTGTNTDSGVLIFTLLQLMDIPFLFFAVCAPLLLMWKERRTRKLVRT